MNLNRIQIQIFKKLSKEKELEVDMYVSEYSIKYIEIQRNLLEELTEEEADCWINRAYFESLG